MQRKRGNGLGGLPLKWAALIAGAALAALPFAAPAAVAPQETLTANVEVDRPYVLKGAVDPIYVFLSFSAIEEALAESDRPPLNFGLVLDRSGSMSDGGKMDYLKPAARMAVDRLSGRDAISVVEYDDAITVLWPAQRAGDTRDLKRLIDALEPRGSTDLAGGLMRGIEEVEGYEGRGGMNARVLLLSDGLANVGIVDPAEIGRLVREARRKGVRVSAMGLGRDYDEDLMQRVAEMGGGKYYYVEHPNQLARIFEQELMTAFTTVASDVRIAFESGGAVRKAELVGYEDASEGGGIDLTWSDFYTGEERGLVLRIEADTSDLGELDLGRLTVTFTDVAAKTERSFSRDIAVDVTADTALAESSINGKARAQAIMVEAERAQAEAVKLFEAGKIDEANARLGTLADDLKRQNTTLQDREVANKIEALSVEQRQMTVAAASPTASEDYVKSTKQRMFEARDGKRALYMLQEGDKGYEVERLQQALKDAGYYTGALDGEYDRDVKEAVEKYQTDQKLSVDGVAGPATMDRLGTY